MRVLKLLILAAAVLMLGGCAGGTWMSGMTFTYKNPGVVRQYGDPNSASGLTDIHCSESYRTNSIFAVLGDTVVDDQAETRSRNHCTATHSVGVGIGYDGRRFGEVRRETRRTYGSETVNERFFDAEVTRTRRSDWARSSDRFDPPRSGRTRVYRYPLKN